MLRASITIVTLTILVSAGVLFAQEPGYSRTTLESLKPAKPSGRSCVKLEAKFSEPLAQQPSAVMESNDSSMIDGVLKYILRVTKITSTKYFLSLVSSDEQTCQTLKRNVHRMSVTVDGATGVDGKRLLPEQKTFSTRALF